MLGMTGRWWRPWGDEAALLGLMLLKTLLLLSPSLLLFWVVRRWSQAAGWGLLLVTWTVAMGWLGLDLACKSLTGNPISYYLSFLSDVMGTPRNQGVEFAGGGDVLLRPVALTLLTLFLMGAILLLLSRWLGSRLRGGTVALLVGLAFVAALASQVLWSESGLAWKAYRRLPYGLDPVRRAAFSVRRLWQPSVRIVSLTPRRSTFPPLIEIENQGKATVSLRGWQLTNRVHQVLNLDGELEPGQSRTLFHPSFVLHEKGDVVSLQQGRRTVDRVQFLPQQVQGWSPISFREREGFDRFRNELMRQLTPDFRQLIRALETAQPPDPGAEVKQRPSVVILVVESLRRDGMNPKDTPELMAWAEKGLWLQRHYASTNTSHLGLFALLYGRNPLFYDRDLILQHKPALLDFLGRAGYRLRFWCSSVFGTWRGMHLYLHDRFWNEIVVPPAGITWETWVQRDRELLARVPDELARARAPELIVLFLKSTHFPYGFPPEFELNKPSLEGQITWQNWTQADPVVLRNRYRNSLSFLSHDIDAMLRRLDLSRTIVVVTGDHGESFFEDGALSHGTRGSEVQTAVPCLILGAGVPRRQIGTLTGHVDLVPTLYHLLGGRNLRAVHGRDLLEGRLDDAVLVTPLRSWSPFELVLHMGDRRLQLNVSTRPYSVEVAGFLDDKGDLQLSESPPLSDVPRWVEALRRELARLR